MINPYCICMESDFFLRKQTRGNSSYEQPEAKQYALSPTEQTGETKKHVLSARNQDKTCKSTAKSMPCFNSKPGSRCLVAGIPRREVPFSSGKPTGPFAFSPPQCMRVYGHVTTTMHGMSTPPTYGEHAMSAQTLGVSLYQG